MNDDSDGYRTVRIPADVGKADQVIGTLTLRQAAIVGGSGVALWLAWTAVQGWVPPLLFLPPALLALLLVTLAVTITRDGVSLDRLLLSALRQGIAPRRQVMAPEGVGRPPSFLAEAMHGDTKPAVPLDLPIRSIDDAGIVRLGSDGVSVLAESTTVNFALRTHAEQELLVGGFARWLNTLTGPVQIIARTTPADLNDQVSVLRARAGGLPHPLLEQAALDHADFLDDLASRRSLMDRTVLIAAHEADPKSAQRLLRRAHDTAAVLAGCELNVTVLDSDTAREVLGAALDPDRSPSPAPSDRSGAAR